jgi:mRNA-degrading endonuclease HigB of HigAB toxin-antitoxin module
MNVCFNNSICIFAVNIHGNKYYKVQRFGWKIFKVFILWCVTLIQYHTVKNREGNLV